MLLSAAVSCHLVSRYLSFSGLDHEDGGTLVRGPLGQLLGVVDAEGLVVDPGVDDEVGELAQQLDPGAPNRGGHERPRAGPVHRSSFGRRSHS